MTWKSNFASPVGSLEVLPGVWQLLDLRKTSYGEELTLQSPGRAKVLDFTFYKEYWVPDGEVEGLMKPGRNSCRAGCRGIF